MKKNKKSRKALKMTPEQVQGLLHIRHRAYVQKNMKAENKKKECRKKW